MAQRTILHVDLNSFFAIAEQQANPALRGKPVGIVKGEGRSCIIAASPEAKKLGIVTGSRSYDARKIFPGIILIPADFAKYEDISRRFFKICFDYSEQVEVFSLDECFIDVTESEKLFGSVFNIAFEIKERLAAEVGDYITVSIGISHNRLLAKLAGEQIKPDGLYWIREDNMLEILDQSKLMDVCGLGFGLYHHLLSLGINSFAKLRTYPLEFLYKNFGPHWSLHLYNICRGIDDSPVVPFANIADAKSVGRTYTTHRVLTKPDEIDKVMRNLCEEATSKARQMGLAGRYVGFTLRNSPRYWSGNIKSEGQKSWYGHRTLQHYISAGCDLFELYKIISKNWKPIDVIFCGVTLAMLAPQEYQPIPLFSTDRKKSRLIKSVDLANRKYGDYTVFPANLLGMPIVMPEVTGFFGDKKYRLNFLREN